ncbi:MAG: hypothetical protein J7L20_03735 [Thermoplasmata archaeon]|nr:hypothetical protein [Thermoplasmata archaeon]
MNTWKKLSKLLDKILELRYELDDGYGEGFIIELQKYAKELQDELPSRAYKKLERAIEKMEKAAENLDLAISEILCVLEFYGEEV